MPTDPKLKGGDWPEMGRAYHAMQTEMPDAIQGLNQIRPMNWLERNTFGSKVNAITYPNNTVIYNADSAKGVMETPEELLRHELTHVRQHRDDYGGTLGAVIKPIFDMFTPYMQRNDEKEAYAAEERMTQSANRGDINLPLAGLQRAK